MELNKNLLHEVMSIQSETFDQTKMQYFILDYVMRVNEELGGIDCEIDDVGNLYFTRGEGKNGYPCMVSHMDTVHKIIPQDQFKIIRYGDTWHGFNPVKYELTGIGGDDKVGVYLCLEALNHFEDVKVAFFVDEEVGCLGSGQASIEWFDDCNLVLQADRRGKDDFVQNIGGEELFGIEFKKAVTPYLLNHGYSVCNWGGITDVGELKEGGLKVACANMSAGYHNPHSDNEYIVLPQVENAMNLAFTIFEELGDRRWEHTSPRKEKTTVIGNDDFEVYWGNEYNYIKPSNLVAKSKLWDEEDHYTQGMYTEYSASTDDYDYKMFEDDYYWGAQNECTMCGDTSLSFDAAEDSYYCMSCQAYVPSTWTVWDDSDVSDILDRDRELLSEVQENKKGRATSKVKKSSRKQEVKVAV